MGMFQSAKAFFPKFNIYSLVELFINTVTVLDRLLTVFVVAGGGKGG